MPKQMTQLKMDEDIAQPSKKLQQAFEMSGHRPSYLMRQSMHELQHKDVQRRACSLLLEQCCIPVNDKLLHVPCVNIRTLRNPPFKLLVVPYSYLFFQGYIYPDAN